MTIDLMHLTQVITDALLRTLGDEVDLIIRYGSHFTGNNHAYSDLDISYVPVHNETGYHITVTVDGMLCDLYPIRWPQLESMARFENVSSTVLLRSEILYQRSDEAAARLHQLAEQLNDSLQPTAQPAMIQKAQAYFQRVGYPFYLLRRQAKAGHQLATLQQAQSIVSIVVHALAICNQQVIDTRKVEQILALPRLPADFATILQRVTATTEPGDLPARCTELLDSTHAFLLGEQQNISGQQATYASAFGAGYPELKNDLYHILLACERQDLFALRRLLVSLYHELSLAITKAERASEFTDFTTLADYEQDFAVLGFPALLPHLQAQDFAELHRSTLVFDAHLQHFLAERGVRLYAYNTVETLQQALVI